MGINNYSNFASVGAVRINIYESDFLECSKL